MVGIHDRDKIVQAEPYWGSILLCHESVEGARGKMVMYWSTEVVKLEEVRENVREMVAILGSMIFEMIILII
jgi:hypothetical protein